MTDIEIRKLGALEIGSAIKEGKITSVQATKAFLDAIEKTDGEYDPLVLLFVLLAVVFSADWMVYCYEKYQLR